ncbi:polysaccharide biosynthesis protein [Actibacterium ureilyticum]|uniref:polysaccharide biosynthesis protein n=1 Tax=Actibacterium ureilyticum TaxID=1590614 RepID=UPI000BAAD1F6|nr:nucleoside-diphosphate sugar epimerase/dehydratase [Actibacterium ureilyticum]
MLRILKSLSRRQKQAAFLATDLLLVPVAVITSAAISGNGAVRFAVMPEFWLYIPFLISTAAVIALVLGIPRIRLNDYQGDAVLRTAVFAVCLALALAGLCQIAAQPITLRGQVIFAMTYFLLSAGSRLVMLRLLLWLHHRAGDRKPVVIYGAGVSGRQIATALRTSKRCEVVAFVDDSPSLQGMRVAGARVHAPRDLPRLVADKGVQRAILAIPSLNPLKQAQIARRLRHLGVEVQTLPSFAHVVGDAPLVDKLTPLQPDHLLGRAQLDRDIAIGGDSYAGKTVLITGAGGSIGSELCRQVLACGPARLILFELNEFALYTIGMELSSLGAPQRTEVIPVLGSVTDARQVRHLLATHRVDVILHAAAYKHVPLVEQNPVSGVGNNVLGTHTLAQEALRAGVRRFILVSSDKAVRPSNVMGATKRLAEMIVQDLASRSTTTRFAMVRFGNVLGSSGSVVPLFQEQIARGGPVTVTDAAVSRYFMTVQEAVHLVLLAGSFARAGEVFVLDMGAPIPIRDMARQMIEASGQSVRDAANPDGDIEIAFVGLRPGEKLHEELLIGDGMTTTPHPKILCAQERGLSQIQIAAMIRDLRLAVEGGDADAIRALLSHSVEGYRTAMAQQVT